MTEPATQAITAVTNFFFKLGKKIQLKPNLREYTLIIPFEDNSTKMSAVSLNKINQKKKKDCTKL